MVEFISFHSLYMETFSSGNLPCGINQTKYLPDIYKAIPFPGNQTSVLLWHDGSEEPRDFPKQSYVASVHLVAH